MKLLEQPIISIKDASVVGSVKGLVLEGSKVVSIYDSLDRFFLTVPLKGAEAGSDAVMVPEMEAVVISLKPRRTLDSFEQVFNCQGKHLGDLIGLEIDESFEIKSLLTDRYEIAFSKLVSIGDVILAEADESELEENSKVDFSGSEAELVAEKLRNEVNSYIDYGIEKTDETIEKPVESTKAVSAEQAAAAIEGKPQAEQEAQPKEAVEELKTALKTVHSFAIYEEAPENIQTETKAAFASAKNNSTVMSADTSEAADFKYQYLYGKKLLEDIEINGRGFGKDYLIDIELVKYAIENNSIVKVIMNAED